jgi:hypothetical protein
MGLVNRIIERLELTHQPNLTLTEQLTSVNIHYGFVLLPYANMTPP